MANLKSLREVWWHFYSGIINRSPGNFKELFSTICHLLRAQSLSLTVTTEEQCNHFMDFYQRQHHLLFLLLLPACSSCWPTIFPATLLLRWSCTSSGWGHHLQDDTVYLCLAPLCHCLFKIKHPCFFPLITQIRNHSLQAGHLPSVLKTGLFSKKPYSGSLPIYHFCQRCWTKLLLLSFTTHTNSHKSLYEKFQSGFCSSYSTENAARSQMTWWCPSWHAPYPPSFNYWSLWLCPELVPVLPVGKNEVCFPWWGKTLDSPSHLWCPSRVSSRPHSVHPIHAPPQQCHGLSFHCYADDTQLEYISKQTQPTQLPSAKWLQNWGYFSWHHTPGPVISRNPVHHSPFHICYQPGG